MDAGRAIRIVDFENPVARVNFIDQAAKRDFQVPMNYVVIFRVPFVVVALPPCARILDADKITRGVKRGGVITAGYLPFGDGGKVRIAWKAPRRFSPGHFAGWWWLWRGCRRTHGTAAGNQEAPNKDED